MNAVLMLLLAADPSGVADSDVVLLDFTAGYCQPCQQMLPALQRMEHDGFPIRRIDITEEHTLSRQYDVQRIPTLVLLVRGQEVKRFVGLTAESELRREMNNAARAIRPQQQPESAVADAATPEITTPEAAPARKTFTQRLAELFGAGGGDDTPLTIRGQDPASSTEPDRKLVQAFAATVRIRVSDARREDVGSGTIIHSTHGASHILTCAHLFMGFQKDAAVEVDVFTGDSARRFPATIVGGNHDSDLAVIRIQNAEPLPCVKLSTQPPEVTNDQTLVSFGCNNGATPTPLKTRVVKLNPYLGPANMTCNIPPTQGRSGGGLFDVAGGLLGVCSAADPERTEGLYMAHQAVMDLMNQLNLQHLPDNSSAGTRNNDAPLLADNQTMPPAAEEFPFDSLEDTPAAPATLTPNPVAPGTERMPPATGAPRIGPEITVVIDPGTPGSQKQIVVIPQASPWLVELLTGQEASHANVALANQ